MSEKPFSVGWSDHRFIAFDKTPVFFRHFSKKGPVRAQLLILHGMGEHGGRYKELAEFLGGDGIECFLPDLRGFGKSGGKRGCLSHFSDYFEDLNVVHRLASTHGDPKPFFILGHSYGGLVVSSWIAARPEIDCRGLVLSSPNFGIAIRVPLWRQWLAWAVARFYPDMTQDNRVNALFLTHDTEILRERLRDPLIHGRISAGLYGQMRRQMSRASQMAAQIHCPVLLLQAGDDRIVSNEAILAFYEKLVSKDKERQVYDKHYHELLNEWDRPLIFSKISDWLRIRC